MAVSSIQTIRSCLPLPLQCSALSFAHKGRKLMHYRTIPNTTLSVSELSFGNFMYGSHMWGKTPADAPEGIRLQNLAFDLGVNFFDTGDAYGNGHAENLMVDTLQ